jgi:hypothetical protein
MRPRQPTEAIRGSAPSWLEPARPWPKQAVRRAGAGPVCGCQSRLAVRFAFHADRVPARIVGLWL